MLSQLLAMIRSLIISPRYDEIMKQADNVAEQNRELSETMSQALLENHDPIQAFTRHLDQARRRR